MNVTGNSAATKNKIKPFHHYAIRAIIFMLGSLVLGVLGYHYSEGMSWLDALLNASMILGGMGPVTELHSESGKLFASFYALYSCFLVLGLFSILVTPSLHKALKHFHSDPK